MTASRLTPYLHHRLRGLPAGPGWRRTALLRRAVAAVLLVLALALAIAPQAGAGGVPVVVAAADLPTGTTLAAAQLVVRTWPADLVPAGAIGAPSYAEGRVLVGAARAGEPLTDVRLTGTGVLGSGGDGADAAVPVRLFDGDVAALLVPGSRVDLVTLGERADAPVVLAADAQVLTVLTAGADPGSRGRLVLVALPRTVAARVAAASLAEQVAVTLR